MINDGARVANDAASFEVGKPSLMAGTDLSTFMLNRYAASLTLLDCADFGGVAGHRPGAGCRCRHQRGHAVGHHGPGHHGPGHHGPGHHGPGS